MRNAPRKVTRHFVEGDIKTVNLSSFIQSLANPAWILDQTSPEPINQKEEKNRRSKASELFQGQ